MHSAFRLLMLIIFLKQCNGVIYYLNETEYERMPPIYYLDDYNDCLQKYSEVYCIVNIDLVSDEPNELLNMIQEYSEQSITHYNHTRLRHGVCATRKCRLYIQNKTAASAESLERCFNDSMWRDYKLKTKVETHYCYVLSDNDITVDTSDILVAVVLLLIVMLNLIGSVLDMVHISNNKTAASLWSCFSISRNWKILVYSTHHSDSRLERLKGINSLRCIILLGVMMVHSSWPIINALENPHTLELNYYNIFQYLFLNGSTALQTYLVISGFLMSYKLEIQSETNKIGWRTVLYAIVMRYFRLTPVYAVTIALLSTWIKFVGPGPFWDMAGNVVRSHCRSRWWQNVLYINNYTYDSQCVLPGWYLGVDMQLFIVGIVTCFSVRRKARRTAVLTILFIIGVTLPAIHIYFRDLDAAMLLSPEPSRTLYKDNPTFNETYKMGHANMASYVVGMALGYLVYRWQQMNVDVKNYTKYRYIFWTLPPLLVGIILSGCVFYRDAPRDPIYVRVLSGALTKPVYGIVTAGFMCGMIFKVENIYRAVFEWKAWAIPSRLSYCVYIIHLPILRVYLSLKTTLVIHSTLNQLILLLCLTVVSFLIAIPLFLLVETPSIELLKYWYSRRTHKPKETFPNSCPEKSEYYNTSL